MQRERNYTAKSLRKTYETNKRYRTLIKTLTNKSELCTEASKQVKTKFKVVTGYIKWQRKMLVLKSKYNHLFRSGEKALIPLKISDVKTPVSRKTLQKLKNTSV